MYIITAELAIANSSRIRDLLCEYNFIIYLTDNARGGLRSIQNCCNDENDEAFLYGNNNSLTFHCVYNGETLPPQELLRQLEEDASVLEYSIKKNS